PFKLTGDGARHRYTLALPGRALPARIRVDPGSGPGRIVVHSIGVANGSASRTLDGAALPGALALRHQLQRLEDPADGGMAMESTGDDPFFDFAPPGLPPEGGLPRYLGAILLLLAGAVLFTWLGWLQVPRARRWGQTLAGHHPALVALIAAGTLLVVLAALGTGCEPLACSPRGLKYGAGLFLGAVGFAIVGAAAFRLLGLGTAALPAPG